MSSGIATAQAAAYPTYPRLEPQSSILTHRSDYLGPTEESNWVIPNCLLVGAFPSAVEDYKNTELLTGTDAACNNGQQGWG
jgi:hypothetical protein